MLHKTETSKGFTPLEVFKRKNLVNFFALRKIEKNKFPAGNQTRYQKLNQPRLLTGFTLIEAVIYIALISITLGFTVLTISQMMDAESQLKSKIEVAAETDFILRKLSWALTNVLTISQPPINSSSSILSIDKNNGSENPLVFDLASGNIRLGRAGGAATVLNNQYVTLNQLSFEHLAASGTVPEALKTTIVIQSSSDSKTIQTINYLKK